jgi:single-strand DNA-binding protein
MYNKVILAGNLTRDIEVRYLQSGGAVANTAIATSRKFKSQSGEQKEEVMFIDITFFGRTAEIANQYLRKGSKVLVEGRLTFQQWVAQDGTKRSKHTITVENLQMLGSRDDAMSSNREDDIYQEPQHNAPKQPNNGGYSKPTQNYQEPQHSAVAPQTKQQIPEIDISAEDIPF